jgi:hypothetical protein
MFTEKNSIYLILGYVVFLGGIGAYLLSLVLRRRNLKRDEEMLEQIAEQIKEEQQTTPPANANASPAEKATTQG